MPATPRMRTTPTPSTRQQAPHAMHQRDTRTLPHPRHPRASETRTPVTPRMRTHTASNTAKASFVAQGGAHGVCPPRLLRSGCRRFQHMPPCTNATHAHAYPRHPRASNPRRRTHTASNAAKASFVAQGRTQGVCPPRLSRTGARRRQRVPPCTNATHARTATPRLHASASCARCHTIHAHAYPRHPRASKTAHACRAAHTRTHTASNAAKASFVAQGGAYGLARRDC